MYAWRISKYDPKFRNEAGHYLKEEWIGPAEIGKMFADGMLSEHEYCRIESLYVNAVLRLWTGAGEPPLQIKALQIADAFGLPTGLDSLSDVGFQGWEPRNGERIAEPQRIAAMIRYCLRSFGWCELSGETFEVRFGYDYYIEIAALVPQDEERKAIVESGLFVEVSTFSPPDPLPSDFQIEAIRKDEEVIAHIVPLPKLGASEAIDIWPDVPALAGYRTRRIDAAMAGTIRQYVKYDFDFSEFEYWLALVD